MAKPHPSPFAHGRSEIHGRKSLAAAIDKERRRLGRRLKTLRLARELTQAAAAEAIGIHPVHVARIEAGTVNVTISTLTAFAIAYRAPLRDLFDDSATRR